MQPALSVLPALPQVSYAPPPYTPPSKPPSSGVPGYADDNPRDRDAEDRPNRVVVTLLGLTFLGFLIFSGNAVYKQLYPPRPWYCRHFSVVCALLGI
jgi:hypothetical protein